MDPSFVLLVIYISLLGTALGAFTGITPGIHVNTMALFVLLMAPLLLTGMGPFLSMLGTDPELAPVLLAVLLVSASVSHSFLDFLPSVFLGAPEESECLSMLPGHRLLLSGRGLDAVTVAAQGSLVGALLSILVCAPLLLIGPAIHLDEKVGPYVPGLLVLVILLFIMNEGGGSGASFGIVMDKAFKACPSSQPPLPVNGFRAEVFGLVSRRGLFGRSLMTDDREWSLHHHHGLSPGHYLIVGTWRARRTRWTRLGWALLIFSLSGLIGLAVLQGRPGPQGMFAGLGTSLLLPMLTGLFAVPALIEARNAGSVPEQHPARVGHVSTIGCLQAAMAGLFTAWVPGVTSTSGTVLAQQMSDHDSDDQEERALRFISMTAALGTAATVFGVLALLLTGSGGTGVLVAVADIVPSETEMLPLAVTLLLATLTSSFAAFYLTRFCGERMARSLSGRRSGSLSRFILVLEISICLLLTGMPGMSVLVACSVLGALPPRVSVSRVCLTGCLLLPLALGYLGLEASTIAALGG